jgi:hypothetical protein
VSAVYPICKEALLAGDINFETDSIMVVLVGAPFVFLPDDAVIGDVDGVIDDPRPVAVLSIADGVVEVGDVTFPDIAGATHVTGLVAYHNNVLPADRILLCHIDRRADTVPIDVTPNGGDLTFSFTYLMKL